GELGRLWLLVALSLEYRTWRIPLSLRRVPRFRLAYAVAYPNRPRYCHYGQPYIFPRRNDCPAGTRRTCSCCFLPADAAPRKSSSGGRVAWAGCFRGNHAPFVFPTHGVMGIQHSAAAFQ